MRHTFRAIQILSLQRYNYLLWHILLVLNNWIFLSHFQWISWQTWCLCVSYNCIFSRIFSEAAGRLGLSVLVTTVFSVVFSVNQLAEFGACPLVTTWLSSFIFSETAGRLGVEAPQVSDWQRQWCLLYAGMDIMMMQIIPGSIKNKLLNAKNIHITVLYMSFYQMAQVCCIFYIQHVQYLWLWM